MMSLTTRVRRKNTDTKRRDFLKCAGLGVLLASGCRKPSPSLRSRRPIIPGKPLTELDLDKPHKLAG